MKTELLKKALGLVCQHNWEEANDVLGGFGVEFVSFGGKELKYINMGDTYTETVCMELADCGLCQAPFIGSWGNWYESAEQEYENETGTIRCGYCGEFTELNRDDWRQVVCDSCGHYVSGEQVN